MFQRESYKGHLIEVIKQADDAWKATVTRQDGSLIEIKYGNGPVLSITTSARFSELTALAEAKIMIDGDGMDASD